MAIIPRQALWKLFFEVVFPSLLPFFILSDVPLSTGMAHYLGVWFEPLMRPLFNAPGGGSFVFSMELAAGYPMGAVITVKGIFNWLLGTFGAGNLSLR